MDARIFGRLLRRLEEPAPVVDIGEDGLAVVTPIHDVVDCPWILNAQLTSHRPPSCTR